MAYGFLDIAITPSVRAAQAEMGADSLWTDFPGHRDFDRFTEAEAAFITDRDSFYMAAVSETGWPYMQHRGGPRGFLKVLDERTLALDADPALTALVVVPGYRGKSERIVPLRLRAFDWNCAQHITPRWSEAEIRALQDPAQA